LPAEGVGEPNGRHRDVFSGDKELPFPGELVKLPSSRRSDSIPAPMHADPRHFQKQSLIEPPLYLVVEAGPCAAGVAVHLDTVEDGSIAHRLARLQDPGCKRVGVAEQSRDGLRGYWDEANSCHRPSSSGP
jgi:hypothetical protein